MASRAALSASVLFESARSTEAFLLGAFFRTNSRRGGKRFFMVSAIFALYISSVTPNRKLAVPK